ncbi:MAG: SDR family NAD(P)-dependent oxidoreductase [Halioglobus sp.]|nr:SDR family NAD(P)-dependent oxidoreductase [Halioglobus sp.]
MGKYAGKKVFITGAAVGLGRALAVSFAEAGAAVAVADIDIDRAIDTAEHITSLGCEAFALKCDVAEIADINAAMSSAWERWGVVDFACINAGVVQLGSLIDSSDQDLQWMFSVNLFGALNTAKAYVREARKRQKRGGQIVFTGSESCLSLPEAARLMGIGGYNMSKHAMLSMSDTLRFELAGDGIGVSLLIPGGVKTEVLTAGRNRQEKFGGPSAPVVPDMSAVPADLAMAGMISAEEAAQYALDGIGKELFYIPTHAYILSDFRARADEIEAAFKRMTAIS